MVYLNKQESAIVTAIAADEFHKGVEEQSAQ